MPAFIDLIFAVIFIEIDAAILHDALGDMLALRVDVFCCFQILMVLHGEPLDYI